MTIEEACELWMRRDFSNVSTELVKRAYRETMEDLELLSSREPELDYPCAWGWMFTPDDECDEEWILENIDEVEACGFFVFQSDECGVMLGVDSVGYSYFDTHWLPLYKARGFRWHLTEDDDTEEEEN